MASDPSIPSIQELRAAMAQTEAAGLEQLGPCPSHLGEAWIDIPLPDGQTNRTKVVWPRSSVQCPLVIYFHGGGFSMCSPDLLLAPARGFADRFSCVVACPTLDQLPEQPFPAPVRIAWEVCAWLSDVKNLNDGVLKDAGASVDPGRGFVVGGLSAGGAAAAVIATIPGAIAAGVEDFAGLTPLQNPITGIFSGIPYLVSEAMLPAQYRDILKSRDEDLENKAMNDAMRQDLESRLLVFIYGGELDQFRDDSTIYAKWLSQLEGVQVRASVLEGVGHTGWVSLLPEPATPRLKEVTLDGMAWLLNLGS
ncbi:alpha/beta-hydrolase [Xylaria longipes]|nr:alpha/beta-hydrolase [Xylaria longipes]